MGIKRLMLFVISAAVVVLCASGCGTGQIKFGDVGIELPTGEEPGGEEPLVPGGGGTMSIESVFPPVGSRGAAMGTDITATFDVSIDPSTINGNIFVALTGIVPSLSSPIKAIPGPVFSENVPGNFSYDEETLTLTFNPEGKLRDCEIYEVTVTTGLRSTGGESLPEDYTWQFLSACPGVMTKDFGGDEDIGYGVYVDADGKMYVSGAIVAGSYSYAPWLDKIDTSAGLGGSSDWAGLSGGGAYDGYILEDMKDPGAPPHQADGIGVIHDTGSGNLFTAGWENPDWDPYGWFQKLNSAGAGQLAPDTKGITLDPGAQISCRGFAQSPTSGHFAITCLDYGVETSSYLFILDQNGNEIASGSYLNTDSLWGDESMFNRCTFDGSGNLYVTLAPFFYVSNLTPTDRMRVLKFNASQLNASPIGDPTSVAEHSSVMSAGMDLAVVQENGATVMYVAGYNNTGAEGVDGLIAKFDASGTLLWDASHRGPGAAAGAPTDMFTAVDYYDGHVYVTGYEGRTNDGGASLEWWDTERKNMILEKYAADGTLISESSYQFGIFGASDSSMGFDVFVDPHANGEITVVGAIYKGPPASWGGAGDGKDVAIWRFDNDVDGKPYCQDPNYIGPNCSPEPYCMDLLDNDVDGDVDCADVDCADDPACQPGGEAICKDFFDNDADGDIDCADSDCGFFYRCGGSENTAGDDKCSDGIDNDLDGDMDCADWDCKSGPIPPCESAEATCDDDFDNDADGDVDCCDSDCEMACPSVESTCMDKVDNDADGDTDCEDSDCIACNKCEIPNELTCSDMFDNDGDGLQDCADVDDCPPVIDDPQTGDCEVTETLCTDFFDNDGDGVWDCDKPLPGGGDPDCAAHFACGGTESSCVDGIDNDFDDLIDCADPDCFDPACAPEAYCDDWGDNDADGLTDCEDDDCDGIGYCEYGVELTCDDWEDNDADGNTDCDDDDCTDDPACVVCDIISCSDAEFICTMWPDDCDTFSGDWCLALFWRDFECSGDCCESTLGCDDFSCAGAQAYCEATGNCDDPGSYGGDWCSAFNYSSDYSCDIPSGCCVYTP